MRKAHGLSFGPGRRFHGDPGAQQKEDYAMSNSLKALIALSFVGFLSACGQQEEEVVYVEPEPISEEPTYTGKYK